LTPDELIRRFDSGDRQPDLLRQLSDLAWHQFHDPWERRPGPVAEEAGIPATGPGRTPGDPQERLRPFTSDTLVRYLRAIDRPFWECGPDRYVAPYEYDPASDRCCQAFYSVEGRDPDILCVRWVSDRRVPAEQLSLAYLLCNQWNAQWRWPRAFVDLPTVTDADGQPGSGLPPSGVLTLDFQLHLQQRIHQALFDSLLAPVQEATWAFWEMAHRDYNL
jgi:hypothetical protein